MPGERVKTLELGTHKKKQTEALLAKASPERNFRDALDKEARELTRIGNEFLIRHSETNRTPITESRHVDYLFHRLFSLIHLLLQFRQGGSVTLFQFLDPAR